jgi:hypothetical protein
MLTLATAIALPGLALAGLWRRVTPAMPASEAILAAAVSLLFVSIYKWAFEPVH